MRLNRVLAAACLLSVTVLCTPTLSQSPAPSPSPAPSARVIDFANLKRYQADNAALPPATADSHRVVFMGDSITQSWASKRPEFFAPNGFVGRGISGQTTSQMVLRFHQDVVALQPAVVVIIAGTNDVAENTGPITDAQVIDNLATMVEVARAHGIRPVVGSIPPATYFFWRKEIQPNPRISELNAKIKAWAQAQLVTYADVWSAMALPDSGMKPEYADDSVHPTPAGYAVMEPIVRAAIADALKAGR